MTIHRNHILLLVLFLVLFFLRVEQVGGLRADRATQGDNYSLSSQLRRGLSEKVSELLPEPQAALLSGMLIGQQSDLPKDFQQALKNTSTVHIVVVSGENLSLVAGFVMVLAPLLGRRKTLALTSLVVLGYSFLTGFQVPVIRAALMVELSYLAQFLGKESDSSWTLLVVGALMLLYNPNWLLSISFQLSFLATLAVLVISPIIIKLLNFLPDLIKQDLGVSLAVQLLTWPVVAANFHQLSLIGVLINSLILFSVAPIMITGAAALAGAWIFLGLGKLLAWVPLILLSYFVDLVNFGNSVPFVQTYVGNLPGVFWLGYYLLLGGLFLYVINWNYAKNEAGTGFKSSSSQTGL